MRLHVIAMVRLLSGRLRAVYGDTILCAEMTAFAAFDTVKHTAGPRALMPDARPMHGEDAWRIRGTIRDNGRGNCRGKAHDGTKPIR
jgi:hypothetical protein